MPTPADLVRSLFARIEPIPPGPYSFQTPPDAPRQYRLHLRVEPDGSGVLIVNAATVLHLNRTATEYAYHLVRQTPQSQVAATISSRYRVQKKDAENHYRDFVERIETVIHRPEIDPETFLDFDRRPPYSTQLSAPYRLDCALTYHVPPGVDQSTAPEAELKGELSENQWELVLQKAWEAGVPHVVFTGGEPTLRTDLCDLITFAQKQGQVTGMISDGLRLNDPLFLKKILQSGLDHLTLLLQPEVPSSWKALEACLKADLFTVVHLTLFRETVDQVTGFLDRLSQMNIHAVSLSTDEASLARPLHAARDRSAHLGLKLVWDEAVPYGHFNPVALETETPKAGAGRAWLYVEPDGEVLPGQGIHHPLGNLVQQPWATVWQKAKEFRA
jgi:hypothetical protein